jgi:hypothetical protein
VVAAAKQRDKIQERTLRCYWNLQRATPRRALIECADPCAYLDRSRHACSFANDETSSLLHRILILWSDTCSGNYPVPTRNSSRKSVV